MLNGELVVSGIISGTVLDGELVVSGIISGTVLDGELVVSGIISGTVLDGELLYTKILEVNLFAFAYRLFHQDFSPNLQGEIFMKQSVGKCK